jgi:hypothetical protein
VRVVALSMTAQAVYRRHRCYCRCHRGCHHRGCCLLSSERHRGPTGECPPRPLPRHGRTMSLGGVSRQRCQCLL